VHCRVLHNPMVIDTWIMITSRSLEDRLASGVIASNFDKVASSLLLTWSKFVKCSG
jgi:hypothetical protein